MNHFNKNKKIKNLLIIVSKKLFNSSVARNLIRRIIKNFFKKKKFIFSMKYVFYINIDSLNFSIIELKKKIYIDLYNYISMFYIKSYNLF